MLEVEAVKSITVLGAKNLNKPYTCNLSVYLGSTFPARVMQADSSVLAIGQLYSFQYGIVFQASGLLFVVQLPLWST